MKVKSESEVTQSYPTLGDLMDRSLPASSVHGIFQARVLERGAIAFSVPYTTRVQFLPNKEVIHVFINNTYVSKPSFRFFSRRSVF